jgi:trans-aconitate 2-methyltransferase
MARAAAVWDPAQYLRFAGERLRPALDLLAQIPLETPARVVDLGCGAGNVTAILAQRYPGADVGGIDASPAMLERARRAVPAGRFEQADFFTWQPATPIDLIYSNAALQWVDRHASLFPRLLALVAPGGALAVQMPAMHDTPLRQIPYELAQTPRWGEYLRDVTSAPAILSQQEYWDLLRPHAASLDIWQTTYVHALSGDHAVAEWASGSSLKPFLDRLPDALKPAFREAYSEAARVHYPQRADGTTLLPFQRLFIVACAATRPR